MTTTQSLPHVVLNGQGASAAVYENGAHVTAYRVAEHEHPVLWESGLSNWNAGDPIRGGIPLCWPWFGGFGPEGGPAHGFARTAQWRVLTTTTLSTGASRCELALSDSKATRALWDQSFELRLTVTVGRELDVALRVTNTGDRATSWTGALHTYFAVSDVRQVSIHGLEGCTYRDRMADDARVVQDGPITFTEETDRIYYGGEPTLRLRDPQWKRTIDITGRGSGSTVVWNPWVAKAARMADFGDDEWPQMCCVETARAPEDECELAPGQSHELGTKVSVS